MKALKDLTKEEIIEEHRKMWNWIADYYKEYAFSGPMCSLYNIKKIYISAAYPEYVDELFSIGNCGCFACYWANKHSNKTISERCKNCIFENKTKKCMNGIYDDLQFTISSFLNPIDMPLKDRVKNHNRIVELCKKIADMKPAPEESVSLYCLELKDPKLPNGSYIVDLEERSIEKKPNGECGDLIFKITIDNTDFFEKLKQIGCSTKDNIIIYDGKIMKDPFITKREAIEYACYSSDFTKKMFNTLYGISSMYYESFSCPCGDIPDCFVPIRKTTDESTIC